MLFEDEQRVIAVATEMAVVGRVLLPAKYRAFGTVDIKDQIGWLTKTLDPVNQPSGKVGKCCKIPG